jgi:hypothetical protein
MFEGRIFFEDIMGEYRYTKVDGWAHTADIAPNFIGVNFYKDFTVDGNDIFAETYEKEDVIIYFFFAEHIAKCTTALLFKSHYR